ncbi:MAG TPA: hypothetical protein VGG57_23830 [Stellaceae bacterium]|jgi:hypothetical protein
MALRIETFSNVSGGGNVLYKALSHPHTAAGGRALVEELRRGEAAIIDPSGAAEGFAEIFGVGAAQVYVQDVSRIGKKLLGHPARALTDLPRCEARTVLIAAFDAGRIIEQVAALVAPGTRILSLDPLRLPPQRLTNPARYLDPLNFATNFALFRDGPGIHTRVVTANYWARYGAGAVKCWLTLFGGNGEILAEWTEECTDPEAAIAIDSRDVRARFGLGEFAGQLFIHVIGAAGHDVVKYALDTYGDDDRALSCTHDANAWPADRYAGLPAPAPGERVVVWIQNSHPGAIPAGAIGLVAMGEENIVPIGQEIAPFASLAIDAGKMLPGLAWPRQIELRTGKHVVRPRYEVVTADHRRLAHVNVERDDLRPDPDLPGLAETLGKGYLLPAPILPRSEWRSELLPTPMATRQTELPIAAIVHDPDGREVARREFGRLPRNHETMLDLDSVASALGDGYGHVELVYDFARGGDGDGWLHALFRYRRRDGTHAAETSFGAHVFNTLLTYRDEPQSYTGRPPGLSTRLFLRLGDEPYDTLCHLIYPASTPWHPQSETQIILHDSQGHEAAAATLTIPCSGSRLWRYHEAFDAASRKRAGPAAYIVVRDTTCRLFGYHGLIAPGGRFSLDHMFGF